MLYVSATRAISGWCSVWHRAQDPPLAAAPLLFTADPTIVLPPSSRAPTRRRCDLLRGGGARSPVQDGTKGDTDLAD